MDKSLFTEVTDTLFVEESLTFYLKSWLDAHKNHTVDSNNCVEFANDDKCCFDGSINDLNFLSWLDYEWGFPEKDLFHASIMWGNVITKHSPLIWAKDPNDSLVLIMPEEEVLNFAFYPQLHLLEVKYRSLPSENTFEYLTARLYYDLLEAQFDGQDFPNLVKLLTDFCEWVDFETIPYDSLWDHFNYTKDRNKLGKIIKELNDNLSNISD